MFLCLSVSILKALFEKTHGIFHVRNVSKMIVAKPQEKGVPLSVCSNFEGIVLPPSGFAEVQLSHCIVNLALINGNNAPLIFEIYFLDLLFSGSQT